MHVTMNHHGLGNNIMKDIPVMYGSPHFFHPLREHGLITVPQKDIPVMYGNMVSGEWVRSQGFRA